MGLPCKYCGYPYTISGVCDKEQCKRAGERSDSGFACLVTLIIGILMLAWIVRTIAAIFAWIYKEVVAFGAWIVRPVPLATVTLVVFTPMVVLFVVRSIPVTRQGISRAAVRRRMILNLSLAVALFFPTAWAVLRAANAPGTASTAGGSQPEHDKLKASTRPAPAAPISRAQNASPAANADGEQSTHSDSVAQDTATGGSGNATALQDGSLSLVGSIDFSTPDAPQQGVAMTAGSNFGYFESFGGNWRITAKDGGFTGRFSAPAKGRYFMSVTHLSSWAAPCSGNGFAPITISLNSVPIVEDYDPAEHHHGSHDWVKDTWSFPVKAGDNTLSWTAGAVCTDYWIQRIELLSETGTPRH